MATETYSTPGTYTLTLPDPVGQVTVTLRGASGEGEGGGGALIEADSDEFEGGESLEINVGGVGQGGGIRGYEGGAASDIRLAGTSLSDRAIVAGAGGGEGEFGSGGGDGGLPQGASGAFGGADASGDTGAEGGDGGTQTSGGAGGTGAENEFGGAGDDGTDGVFGFGGDGGAGYNTSGADGGGGGDGWYGGGGGGGGTGDSGLDGAGGGGGSSYYDDSQFALTNDTDGENSGDGEVVITYEEPPTPPSNVAASLDGSNDVSLTWTNEAADTEYDEIRIYRDTATGVSASDTLVAQLAPGTTSYTDTGVVDGREYHYVLYAWDTTISENAPSDEVTIQTTLPAPTNLSVDAERAAEVDLSWTANHDNSETRVDIAEDDDGNWSEATTVDYTIESVTLSGLLNGQLYGARVVAQTPDAETVDQ